jgi:hypothetical protein
VQHAVGRLSHQDIKDVVQGLVQAHKSADEAGVADLPQPKGSFAELNGVDVGASIRLLTALAKFGNWKCGTSTPDLPSDYPEDPSVSHARNSFVNGINLLEAKALKARTTSESTRASMTKFIFNKIGVPSAEWDLLAKTALGKIGQGHRLWKSDGGSISPWRVEFYLRGVGVTTPEIVGIISK